MKKLVFLFFIFLNLQAFAERTTQVNELNIQGLGAYYGQLATVFYVSGRKAVITTGGSRLQVFTVLAKSPEIPIQKDGIITVQSTIVPKVNGRKFNFIYIVIHQQPSIYIRNPSGNYPEDFRIPDGNYGQIPTEAFNFTGLFPVEFIENVHTGGEVSVITL